MPSHTFFYRAPRLQTFLIGHQGYNFHQGSAPRLQTFLGEHQGYNIHQGVAPRLQTFLVGHQGYNFHQGVAPRLPTWHQGYNFHQGVAPRSVSPKYIAKAVLISSFETAARRATSFGGKFLNSSILR